MTSARLRAARWLVPLAVVALVLGAAGLRATLANAAPSLPKLTAAQLLAKVAQSDVQSLSGVVRTSADLGLPALPAADGVLGPQALLAGENTLRVYLDGPDRQRVDLLGRLAETKFVHNGRDIWHWSSSTNKATHTRLPEQRPGKLKRPGTKPDRDKMPAGTPQAIAQHFLDMVGPTTQVGVGTAATVAGRSAYDLRLAPRTADSLIRRVDLYVDSATGLPLRATVLARGSSKPAIDVGFTSIKLGAPPASVFRFKAPAGARVTERTGPLDRLGPLDQADPPRRWTGPRHPDKANPPQVTPKNANPKTPCPGKAPLDRTQPGEAFLAPGLALPATPRVHGSGWATAVEIRDVSGATASPLVMTFLKGARKATGRFGSGRLLTTRLLTVLITDDGRIFAGPVTATALLRIANAAGPR